MDSELDKVKEKIRRLLALAEHPNTNIHEAEQAAAKAQELMFKYNLRESQIPSEQRGKEEWIRKTHDLGKGKSLGWKRDLFFGVAKFNFCRGIAIHDIDWRGHLHRTPYMDIVGEPHNIEFVEYLVVYLSDEIGRLSEKFWDEEGHGSKMSWKQQFCYGAVAGAVEVLRKKYYEQVQASVNTKALVLVKDNAVMDAMRKLAPGTVPVNMSGAKSGREYWRGHEEGKKISVDRPVKTTANGGYIE